MTGLGNVKSEGFERVFDLVGGHGLFQWRLLLIVSLQLIVLTWNHIGYAFLGVVPDHWCYLEGLKDSNWTEEQIKLISIPRENDPDNLESFKFKKCEYHNLDYEKLTGLSFDEAYSSIEFANVSTKFCERWTFDKSLYEATVATEFDLVCDNRWKAATIQGLYMVGNMCGVLVFGFMSDTFLGRRRTILCCSSIAVIAGILASFATSYWMFVLCRFFLAGGVGGTMQNSFVMVMEHADIRRRAVLAIVMQVAFALGFMSLPGLAYLLRDWHDLQLAFGLLSSSLAVYYWIMPDSPRWLATHGRLDEAIDYLNKMAKVNRLPRPKREDLLAILKTFSAEESQKKVTSIPLVGAAGDDEISERKKTGRSRELCSSVGKPLRGLATHFKKLMGTAEIRRRSFVFWTIFMTVAMVYYGNVFSTNLTSNPFLLVFLGGLMEIPAYTVTVPFVVKLGRRLTIIGNFVLTGICMIALSQTPREYDNVRLTLALLAKLFVSAGFAIIYLLGAELYPTELRTTGIAVGQFFARVGSVSAPYIVDLVQIVSKELPTIIFGAGALFGAVVAFFLPETKKVEMSDKVYEIEKQAVEEKQRRQSMISNSSLIK